MNRDFKEALQNRRTHYNITDKSLIADKEIEEIIKFAIKHIPSSFNSQSTRVVLLLGKHHIKLWDITKEMLQKIVSTETFAATEAKINGCFSAGYGTVLFFEDQAVIKGLQSAFPLYQENFPTWSEHTSAMHQLAIWTMLEDAGFGVSLQHYNPLIDEEVIKNWKLPTDWKLIAEMPFGLSTKEPEPKEFKPIEDRIRIFK